MGQTGCLGYVGDEKLPSYIGIIRHYDKPLMSYNKDSVI